MKSFLREYFTFNKRERNGIVVLLSLLILLLAFQGFSGYFIPPFQKVDFSKFTKQITAFEKEQQHLKDSVNLAKARYKAKKAKYLAYKKHKKEKVLIHYFKFNPNKINQKQWMQLGVSKGQAHVIRHYLSKGGHFYKKKDLKKIYGFSDSLYNKLAGYIVIPPRPDSLVHKHRKYVNKADSTRKNIVIELNKADSVQLISLRGIGPFFAKMILEYRRKLGGFVNKQQLLEVYRFDKKRYQMIKDHVTVDSTLVHQFDINNCTIAQLQKHPYISHYVANSIVGYRIEHGHYHKLAEIKKSDLVNDKLYRKIAPYLKLSN